MFPKIIRQIMAKGYDFKKHSEYHYKIFHDHKHTDIWPTSMKYMTKGDKGSSHYFSNKEFIALLGKKTPRPQSNIIMTAEEISVMIEAKNQHEQGLGEILKRINKN